MIIVVALFKSLLIKNQEKTKKKKKIHLRSFVKSKINDQISATSSNNLADKQSLSKYEEQQKYIQKKKSKNREKTAHNF